MRKKAVFVVLVALALWSCSATNGKKPYSFASGEDFTAWTASDRLQYVVGLADAFVYISAKTGHRKGLSECFEKHGVDKVRLMITFENYIKKPLAYDRRYSGADLRTLPAAEAFEKMSLLYCDDEALAR